MAKVSIVPKPGYYRVSRGALVAHVKRGYVLVACDGRAHTQGSSHLDSCDMCADGPWGWRVIRVEPLADGSHKSVRTRAIPPAPYWRRSRAARS